WPAGNPIAVPAVAAVVEVEEFRRQHIRNRGIEYGPPRECIEAAIADFKFAPELAGRLGARDIDHAADGVAPEQRALWATQDFDFADVEEIQELPGAGSEEHAIDHHRHRRIERLLDVRKGQAAH